MDQNSPFRSQFGQDAFLETYIFKELRDGVFVDVGAHDGRTYSNSYFFETQRGWSGLCLEPNPDVFQDLARCRNVVCLQQAAYSRVGQLEFQILERNNDSPVEMLSGLKEHLSQSDAARVQEISETMGQNLRVVTVETIRLAHLFQQQGIDNVHLLSIDTEGSELEVLKGIDFDTVLIHAATIENNDRQPHIADFMSGKGFAPLVRLGVDQVFINRRSEFHTASLRARLAIEMQFARIERRLRRLGILRGERVRYPFKRV